MRKILSLFTLGFFPPLILLAQPVQKNQYLYFQGEGKADSSLQNSTQRRSLSKEAAILDAKSKIAFYIDDLKTKDRRSFKEEIAANKTVERRVKMFVMGAQITKSEWDTYDNCVATVKIHKKNLLKRLKAYE